jgi:hypothetical protein
MRSAVALSRALVERVAATPSSCGEASTGSAEDSTERREEAAAGAIGVDAPFA